MMTLAMSITLDKADQNLVVSTAELRTNNARKIGRVDMKCSSSRGGHLDLVGMGGELAYARLRNLEPDLSPNILDYDFIYNGKTIDVKTTEGNKGNINLNVSGGKSSKMCDWYVLMYCDFPTFQIVGCAPQSTVFDPRYERPNTNNKPGTYFCIPRKDLIPTCPIEQMELNK